MIAIKRLKIRDKPGYIFSGMVNIINIHLDLLLINEFTILKNG